MSDVQQVPTNGFQIPGGNAPQASQPAQQVQEPAQQTQQTQQQAPATGDLSAAIAALTAALGTQQTQQAPQSGEADATVTAGIPTSNLNSYDVAGIEDPTIRSMATVLQFAAKDLDLDRAIGRALGDGRADLIDFAYIKEKGGAQADQIINIAKGIVEAVAAKSASITAEVHALAGDENGWNAGVAVFNQGAPQELRLVVAQMLDSGKADLIKAGAKIVVEFSKSSGYLPSGKAGIVAAAGTPAAQALSKADFQSELQKLNPQDRQFNEKRAELFTRRALGRKLGM